MYSKISSFSLLGALYLLLLVPFMGTLFTSKPYTNVTEVEVLWGKYHVDINYTFTKKEGCSLVTFHVEGSSAGVFVPLHYIDLDGLEKNFNRPPGEHSLNIRVLTDGKYFESIRVHTRHDCGGTMVNKVFTEVTNP